MTLPASRPGRMLETADAARATGGEAMIPHVYESVAQLTQCAACRQVTGCVYTEHGPACRGCLTRRLGLRGAAEAFA